MTTQELIGRVTIQWKGCGSYRVTIEYRGKFYSCTSHNSLAYDRIKDYESPERAVRYSYTYKGALQTLYDECKRVNDL